MTRAIFLVFSNPSSPDRDGEYNEWYNTTHAPDLLNGIDGTVAATRYRLSDVQFFPQATSPRHGYLALYEIEADDLDVVRAQLYGLEGQTALSDAMDWPSVSALVFEQITDRMVAE